VFEHGSGERTNLGTLPRDDLGSRQLKSTIGIEERAARVGEDSRQLL
jgi:hypothetical protein